jgi:hypothetical protein
MHSLQPLNPSYTNRMHGGMAGGAAGDRHPYVASREPMIKNRINA